MIKGEITTLRASVDGEAIIVPPSRLDVKCIADFECTADIAVVLTKGNVLIDLRNVLYLDSTALGALLKARSTAVDFGKKIVLLNAGASTFRILQIANFDRLFEMMPLNS